MNEKDIENEKIENLLRKAHIPEPTPLLKERITTEAKKVWKHSSLEIPWQVPVRRLIASAAAAVLIISITNFSNDLALKKWYLRDIKIKQVNAPDLDTIPEIFNRPYIRHLVSINRKPSITDDSALRDHTKRLRQVLNEMQQNGASNRRLQNGQRSRLFPTQMSSDSYT